MTRKLRYWGWQGRRTGVGQTREICAASTKAALARAAGVKDARELFNLCETGNRTEIHVMEREVGRVYWRPIDDWSNARRRI